MPNYDYQCEACKHGCEYFQKITDEPLKTCPKCHKDALVRGIGGGSATFRFVGEGFYVNDYKSDGACRSGCEGSCKGQA